MDDQNIPPEVLVFPQTLVERVTALLAAAEERRAASQLLEQFFALPPDVRSELLAIMAFLAEVRS